MWLAYLRFDAAAETRNAGCHWRLAASEAADNEFGRAVSSSRDVPRCLSARANGFTQPGTRRPLAIPNS